MKIIGLFGSALDRIRNIVPGRGGARGKAYDPGEYAPEEYDGYSPEPPYGAYPGEDAGAFDAYPPYPTEEYESERAVFEEVPFSDYFPQTAAAAPSEEAPGERNAPEPFDPESYDPEEDVIGQMSMDDLPPVEPPPAPARDNDPDDIPVEEFSLDEMDEDTPPEELSPQASPDESVPGESAEENWAEQLPEYSEETLEEDPRRRPRLLSRRGRLRHPGWETSDLYEYNKENLRFPARRKEWELYQMSNDRFAFSVTYGHAAYMSLVDVTLVDFATGERFSSGKRRFFPGDSLDLDFSGGQPHSLKYEDEELFLSISFDGDVRRILVRSKEFEADISCHDAGDAIVTAVPFDFPGEFAYNYKKIFLDLSGHLTMHNVPQELDGDTFLMLYSGRGIWPYRYTTLWASGAQETEEGILALNLSGGYGAEDAPTENALFLDGKMEKLEGIRFRFSSENYRKPWHISDRDHRIRLTFRPVYDDYTSINWLLVHNTCHQLYGHLSGTVELENGTVREIRDMVFFCRHEIDRW